MEDQKPKKPTLILKKYFGLKEGQTNSEFVDELRDLKSSPSDYEELTKLAATELGMTPDFTE